MAPNIPRRREDDLGCASWVLLQRSYWIGEREGMEETRDGNQGEGTRWRMRCFCKRGGGDRGGDENLAEHDQQWRPHREADDGGRQHRPAGRGRRHSHYHRLGLVAARGGGIEGREGEEADGVAYLPGDGLKAHDDATTVVDKSAAVALAAVEGKGLAGEIPAETARGATAVTVRGGRHGHQPLEDGDDVVQVGGQLSEAMVLDELYRCQQHESFTNAGSYV
ncbi:hypothetical protein GW17_00041571 [Ensete ventricosum]|nr:hypothetical protein GW17_00041571 [Ensete ventricosum]